MKHPDHMVNEVDRIRGKAFQIGLSRDGQIRTVPLLVNGHAQTVISEQCRNAIDAAVHLVQVAKLSNRQWWREVRPRFVLKDQPQVAVEHVRPVVGALLVKELRVLLPVEPAGVERSIRKPDETGFVGTAASK